MIAKFRKIERFNLVLGSFGGIATILMIAAILPDIVARNFLNIAIPAVSEISVALLVIMVFFGLASAQVQGGHFRVTMLDTVFGENTFLKVLKILGLLLSIAVFALTTYLTGRTAYRSFVQQEMEIGVASFPVWPQRIIVCVGLALLTSQLIIDLIRLLRDVPRRLDPRVEGL